MIKIRSRQIINRQRQKLDLMLEEIIDQHKE
jgi:hypothetical protein